MKIKSFECHKSIKNYKKKILGISDAWLMSHLSHRLSEPANHNVDCRILGLFYQFLPLGTSNLKNVGAKIETTINTQS